MISNTTQTKNIKIKIKFLNLHIILLNLIIGNAIQASLLELKN